MDTLILIKSLDDIDHQLANNMYKERTYTHGQLSDQMIEMPEVTRFRLNTTQLCVLCERKLDIINSLYKKGVIDDEGWKEYILSESPKFTPKLHLNVL